MYDTSLDQTMTRINSNSDLEFNELLQWLKKKVRGLNFSMVCFRSLTGAVTKSIKYKVTLPNLSAYKVKINCAI